MSNIIKEYNRLIKMTAELTIQDQECRDELFEMNENKRDMLNNFVVEIMNEKSQFDVSIEAHVRITCALLRIRDIFGVRHANRTLRFCGLEQFGWKEYPVC
jgi:sugar diacid utilization regulator